MGEIADMMIEQEMMCFDDDRYEDRFPYSYGGPHVNLTNRQPLKITHAQLVELAKQAAHDGNIVERAMRNMTLDQVLRRKNDRS